MTQNDRSRLIINDYHHCGHRFSWGFTKVKHKLKLWPSEGKQATFKARGKKIRHRSTDCWIKSCLLMCSGNPHGNSLQGNLQFYNHSRQRCQRNPHGSTLGMPAESHDQLTARPFPINRSTTESFRPTDKTARRAALFSREISGALMWRPSRGFTSARSQLLNLHVWCESFKIKTVLRGEKASSVEVIRSTGPWGYTTFR